MSDRTLSERENEILYLAAEGVTDKAISEALDISAGTVRTYWERLRKKVGAASRTEAVAKVLAGKHREAVASLRLAELRLGLVVQAVEHLAVFLVGKDGLIMTWNPGVLKVLDFTEEQFVAKPFSIVLTDGDVLSGAPTMELRRAEELGRYSDDRWHRRRDDTLIFVKGDTFAIKNDAGEVEFFAKIMQDSTREKQLEEEVESLRAQFLALTRQSEQATGV
ncbi:MAG TPA: LuxR C-terminal-related transcriptional regulator [Fimbriimonadaceae bacterium]|nr:LuxR C-terminal-related transcriptional regulator [Fimbriimonadaceae bacterium]